MLHTLWKETELQKETDISSWEIFHENSKTGHYDKGLPNEQVVREMNKRYDSFPYKQFSKIPLPETNAPFAKTLLDTIMSRKSPEEIKPTVLTLEQLKTILFCGYGITRDNKEHEYINRPFRTVPSGGALYPLELYFYSNGKVQDLKSGLYHYAPTENAIQLIRAGDFDHDLSEALVSFQSHIAQDTAILIFITAVFARSTFKYKEKGYRFALIEAGHVAQNINLAATSLNLGTLNIGGYHDRVIDQFLNIDGLHHSTIYMNAICKGN